MNPTFTPWSAVRLRVTKRYGLWHISLRLADYGWAPLGLSFNTLDEAWACIDSGRLL